MRCSYSRPAASCGWRVGNVRDRAYFVILYIQSTFEHLRDHGRCHEKKVFPRVDRRGKCSLMSHQSTPENDDIPSQQISMHTCSNKAGKGRQCRTTAIWCGSPVDASNCKRRAIPAVLTYLLCDKFASKITPYRQIVQNCVISSMALCDAVPACNRKN